MARAQLLACCKSWIRPPEWSKFRRWPQPFSESRHQSGMCVTGHHHDLGTCHSQERDAADVGDGLKLPQSRTAFGAASGVRYFLFRQRGNKSSHSGVIWRFQQPV